MIDDQIFKESDEKEFRRERFSKSTTTDVGLSIELEHGLRARWHAGGGEHRVLTGAGGVCLPHAAPCCRRLPASRHFGIARKSMCEVAPAVDLALATGALAEERVVVLVWFMQRLAALVGGLLRG